MQPIKKEENEQVLIIDDEADTCYLISVILNNKNISSACASTLAEAKAALSRNTPTLIFLDNHLPDGWGVDFIDFIKYNQPESKILFYSAYATPEVRNNAKIRGADLIMNKPLTKQALETAVDSIVKH